MSNNAPFYEKNIFSSIGSTSAGDSVVVDLKHASKFSCQLVYDVVSQSARVVASAAINFSTSTFTFNDHGFVTGVKVQISTSNTLPDPLLPATDYYVITLTANTFQLAASLADALAGTEIELVDAGVGNQTVTPVALAGASVTFKCSNDATNWTDIQTATSITVDGSLMLSVANVAYLYFKATKALTAGVVDISAVTVVIGDDI